MMKTAIRKPGFRRGVGLIECMVSIGVLAVVAPLALAALLRAGEGGNYARAETRAPAIVEACIEELQVARLGQSENLPTLQAGQEFGATDVVCLAFSNDGSLLGKVEPSSYDKGAGKIGKSDAVFLARLTGKLDDSRDGFPPMLTVTVSIEHPAVAPSDKRRHLDFLTKLP